MTKEQLTDNLKYYIGTQVDKMAQNNPIMGFAKPFISRALEKNFGKINNFLELISDSDGNVDIEGIVSELLEQVRTAEPFIIDTPIIGYVEIGGGQVKLNLPLTDKRLVLDMEDLEAFREIITTKK